jgi:hypothetical protein
MARTISKVLGKIWLRIVKLLVQFLTRVTDSLDYIQTTQKNIS